MIGEKRGPGTAGVPAWFPRGPGAAARSDAQQGHGVHRGRARRARPARPAAAARAARRRSRSRACSRTSAASRPTSRSTSTSTALHDRNEALFFRVVIDNPDEMMPIIYTPTVGLACQQFGHIFQRPRGMFISANDRGRVASVLRNWPLPRRPRSSSSPTASASSASATSAPTAWASRSASSSLYTGCAGVHPTQCLPVMLDVGTNNEALLDDPLYIGLQQQRARPATPTTSWSRSSSPRRSEVFPGRASIQFEDFANHNAFRLLAKYRDRICTFNDDIQGTAAVALAGILSALRVTGGKLAEQTILFFGRGRSRDRHRRPDGRGDGRRGRSPSRGARSRCWLVDSQGARRRRAAPTSPTHKRPYAHEHAPVADFLAAVQGAQADGDHRRRRRRRHVHAGSGRGDGAHQRAADRLRAVESDVEVRVHRASRPTPGAADARCSPAAARSIR